MDSKKRRVDSCEIKSSCNRVSTQLQNHFQSTNPLYNKNLYQEILVFFNSIEIVCTLSLISKWHYHCLKNSMYSILINSILSREFGSCLQDDTYMKFSKGSQAAIPAISLSKTLGNLEKIRHFYNYWIVENIENNTQTPQVVHTPILAAKNKAKVSKRQVIFDYQLDFDQVLNLWRKMMRASEFNTFAFDYYLSQLINDQIDCLTNKILIDDSSTNIAEISSALQRVFTFLVAQAFECNLRSIQTNIKVECDTTDDKVEMKTIDNPNDKNSNDTGSSNCGDSPIKTAEDADVVGMVSCVSFHPDDDVFDVPEINGVVDDVNDVDQVDDVDEVDEVDEVDADDDSNLNLVDQVDDEDEDDEDEDDEDEDIDDDEFDDDSEEEDDDTESDLDCRLVFDNGNAISRHATQDIVVIIGNRILPFVCYVNKTDFGLCKISEMKSKKMWIKLKYILLTVLNKFQMKMLQNIEICDKKTAIAIGADGDNNNNNKNLNEKLDTKNTQTCTTFYFGHWYHLMPLLKPWQYDHHFPSKMVNIYHCIFMAPSFMSQFIKDIIKQGLDISYIAIKQQLKQLNHLKHAGEIGGDTKQDDDDRTTNSEVKHLRQSLSMHLQSLLSVMFRISLEFNAFSYSIIEYPVGRIQDELDRRKHADKEKKRRKQPQRRYANTFVAKKDEFEEKIYQPCLDSDDLLTFISVDQKKEWINIIKQVQLLYVSFFDKVRVVKGWDDEAKPIFTKCLQDVYYPQARWSDIDAYKKYLPQQLHCLRFK